MEFYYLPYNNPKIFNHNKNEILYPNQLHNYNHNSSPVIPISPIKSQNYNKYIFNDEKDSFYNIKKDKDIDYNNNFLNSYKRNPIDYNLNNKQKNISADYDNKSVNFNTNLKRKDNQKLKYSYSYSSLTRDNKSKNKSTNNLFDYSNSNNDIHNPTKNNKDFFNNNQINNKKDNFWNNGDIKENNNLILRNNFLLKENNDKKNSSLNTYKYSNSTNYKYLFDYSAKNSSSNNINFSKYDNYNNGLSLHDKYISPDYIDDLKSKNFYSPINKDEKSNYFFESLNKFQNYINNKQNLNSSQIKSLSNQNKWNNTPTKINYNFKILNKREQNNKDNLLNYILKNSELLKKLIDNLLLKKNNSPNNNNLSLNYVLPKKSNINKNKKTLLLDLDETLVHSSFKTLPMNSDINFNIYLQNKPLRINVLVRPYVQEFLEKMSKLYELIIFTASVPQYANPLLDILDKKKYIIHRLYRQHCISLYGLFIKDLRTIGRDLKNTIILDNNPISYLLNQDNGLPIQTWHSDKNDKELIKLIPLLEYLSRDNIKDIREIIRNVVINNKIEYNLVNSIINNNDNNKKKYSRANSFSNFDKNKNGYLTPKKDTKILINNYYYRNESYNKKNKDKKHDNNNININIINFNISKVIMKEDLKNKNNIKLKEIPISNKSNKNKNQRKIEYLQKIDNIYNSKDKISKENIESLINSKYKYLGHLINDKKQMQNKINKIYNKEIGLKKSILNYKRQFSQNYISSSNKKRNNENINISLNSQNKRYDRKDYNNIINEYQLNHNLKSFYDLSSKKNENNNINNQKGNCLYNNYISYDKNKKSEDINKKLNYNNLTKNYQLFNDNDEINIYDKMNKRASTPSVSHHYIQKKNRDLNKEYIIYNYNNFEYAY